MTRAVEQIEREMAALEESVAAIAQEFHTTYSQYLDALGQAVRQQVILAAYHVCTQGYPERFVERSVSQQQELQKELRNLARQSKAQLMECLKPFEVSNEMMKQPPEETLILTSEDDDLDDDLDDEQAFMFSEDPQVTESFEESLAEQEQHAANPVLSSPNQLVVWQENLEAAVTSVLQTLSHAVNRLLQQAEILPKKLPEPVLEVAAKAGGEASSNLPNLLNLLIETDAENSQGSSLTHVMAIRLRLSEIEFSDATLSVWRSKIRGLLTRLNHLGREYQKKQRERAIAQAEAAWRAVWFEE
ncbi:MAG TPA: hypothetical protein V6C78_17675 [Crinalium sp.]|jgi:hypothetical protein